MEPQRLVRPLNTAGRDRARFRTAASIKRRHGTRPTLEQFKNQGNGSFPAKVKRSVYVMMFIPLLAFLSLSAMRLYDIGKDVHQTGEDKKLFGVVDQDLVSGIDVVLGAEFAMIVFVIALKVLSGDSVWSKRAFLAGIALSTLIALIGNAQDSLFPPGGEEVDRTAFLYLITFAPPLIVLILGEVLALLWLDTITAAHQARERWEYAVSVWDVIDRDPEQHPEWRQVFANVLREEICKLNKITVDDLTTEEWAAMVTDELNAEKWYHSVGTPRSSTEYRGRRNSSAKGVGNSTEQTEHSAGGLVNSVEGEMEQAEKVAFLIGKYPELMTMPRQQAKNRLGVGFSTLYRGIDLYKEKEEGEKEFQHSE